MGLLGVVLVFFQIDVTVLDGFCHCCDLCDHFILFRYTKVCPTQEMGLIFRCSVCSLAQVSIGGEAARDVQDVTAQLAAQNNVTLEYGM